MKEAPWNAALHMSRGCRQSEAYDSVNQLNFNNILEFHTTFSLLSLKLLH
jgi:hypothetical protein